MSWSPDHGSAIQAIIRNIVNASFTLIFRMRFTLRTPRLLGVGYARIVLWFFGDKNQRLIFLKIFSPVFLQVVQSALFLALLSLEDLPVSE